MMVILFCLIVIYFFPVIFTNQVFFYGDIVSIFWPIRQWFFNQLHQGVWPLWNPNIFSGYPIFADMTLSTFYPPAWLLFFNSSIKAVSLLMVAHFFISGYFTYRLARLIKLMPLASLFSAIIYSLSGIMVNYIADPQRFFVISLFPLFFYCLFKGRVVLIAMVLALQIFAGHIQYVFIEVLAALVFCRQIKKLVPAGLLACLLTAVSLLPMLQFIPLTTRPAAYQDLSVFQSFSLNPVSLVRFFLAHFWGIKNQGGAWGTMDTTTIGYLGFLPIILVIINLRKLWQKSLSRQFLLIALIALIISFGTYLPFFKIFTTYIPLFRLFRNPMVFLSLYSFFMALLAGQALQAWRPLRSVIWWTRLFLLTVGLSSITIILIRFNPGWPNLVLNQLAAVIHKTLSSFHTVDQDYLIAKWILTNVLVMGLLAGLAFKSGKKKVIVALTIIDLFIFTRSNLYAIDQKYFKTNRSIVNFLQQNLNGYRFLSSSEAVAYSGLNDLFGTMNTKPMSRDEIGKRLKHQLELLPPNFGMVNNLATVNGYTSFVDRRYAALFTQNVIYSTNLKEIADYNQDIVNRRRDLALSKIDLTNIDFTSPVFNQLGVKYFVTDRDLGLPKENLVFSNGEIDIYQNKGVDEIMSIYTNYYSPGIFYWGAWISGLSWLITLGVLAKLQVPGQKFFLRQLHGN